MRDRFDAVQGIQKPNKFRRGKLLQYAGALRLLLKTLAGQQEFRSSTEVRLDDSLCCDGGGVAARSVFKFLSNGKTLK